METKTAYLGLGANIGDTIGNLREAVRLLGVDPSCTVTAVSPLYKTRPVGVEDQPDFFNAVVEVQTTLAPADLLRLCNDIEDQIGRKRTIKWGPRAIDIDILLLESVYIDEEYLTIPHKYMMERAFVLVPLADIAPDLELPGGVTAKDAASSIDQSGVERAEHEAFGSRTYK